MKYIIFALLALPAMVFADASVKGPNATSVRTVYSSTNVGTSTPVTVIASTQQQSTQVVIFDSSGNTMELIVTGAGGGVDYVLIPPGGGTFKLGIGTGAKLQLLGISGAASAGENDIDLM